MAGISRRLFSRRYPRRARPDWNAGRAAPARQPARATTRRRSRLSAMRWARSVRAVPAAWPRLPSCCALSRNGRSGSRPTAVRGQRCGQLTRSAWPGGADGLGAGRNGRRASRPHAGGRCPDASRRRSSTMTAGGRRGACDGGVRAGRRVWNAERAGLISPATRSALAGRLSPGRFGDRARARALTPGRVAIAGIALHRLQLRVGRAVHCEQQGVVGRFCRTASSTAYS